MQTLWHVPSIMKGCILIALLLKGAQLIWFFIEGSLFSHICQPYNDQSTSQRGVGQRCDQSLGGIIALSVIPASINIMLDGYAFGGFLVSWHHACLCLLPLLLITPFKAQRKSGRWWMTVRMLWIRLFHLRVQGSVFFAMSFLLPRPRLINRQFR